MPNRPTRYRRDSSQQLSRVGGVYWAWPNNAPSLCPPYSSAGQAGIVLLRSFRSRSFVYFMAGRQLLWAQPFRNVFFLYSATNLQGCSVDRHQILTNYVWWLHEWHWVRNLPPPQKKKSGGPRTSKFGVNFRQLGNLVADISGTKQDIVEWKPAMRTFPRRWISYVNCTAVSQAASHHNWPNNWNSRARIEALSVH